MIVRAAACLLVLFAALPREAGAQDGWKETFSPQVLRAHFEPGQRFLVVGAGSTAARPAAAALQEGLSRSGAAFVMNGDALGHITGESDADIVVEAQPLSMDCVVIVRVFPTRDGSASRVVAVAYDKRGDVHRAFSSLQGVTLAAFDAPTVGVPVSTVSGGPARHGQGVSEAAVSSVEMVTQKQISRAVERVATYRSRYLHFGDPRYRHPGRIVAGSRIRPYRGISKKPLNWQAFFEAADHEALAKEYKKRRRTRLLLVTGGAVGLVAGLPLFAVAMANRGSCSFDEPGCQEELHVPQLATGSALSAAGLAFLSVGLFRRSLPVDMHEARRMADEYNEGLRRRLGLDDNLLPAGNRLSAPAKNLPFGQRLSVSPRVGRKGGGLHLGMPF